MDATSHRGPSDRPRVTRAAIRRVARRDAAHARRWIRDNPVLTVVLVTLAHKLVILDLSYRLLGRPTDYLTSLSLRWDGIHYLTLARQGWGVTDAPGLFHAYAFPPLFPLTIRLAGTHDLAPFVLSAAFGVAAAALITHHLGLRAGAFFALFPTWAAYTAFGYSESLYVLLAAAAFLLADRDKPLPGGLAAAAAATTRYLGGLAFLVGSLAWFRRTRRKTILFAAPVLVAGLAVAAWHHTATGSFLVYFEAQQAWWARLAFPWDQIHWYLHGEFTTQPAVRQSAHPSYWLLRNYAFLAVSVLGVIALVRRSRPALASYSAVLVLLMLFVTGTPAISTPRLLLAAYPAIAVLGTRIRTIEGWLVYGLVSIAATCWIVTSHLTGFFA